MEGTAFKEVERYLVNLVVVLRVVLEDLWALLVVKFAGEVVDAALKLFSPFLAVNEPGHWHT